MGLVRCCPLQVCGGHRQHSHAEESSRITKADFCTEEVKFSVKVTRRESECLKGSGVIGLKSKGIKTVFQEMN